MSGVPLVPVDRVTAYKQVLSQVGPLRLDIDPAKPLRDEVTALLVSDVINQKRRKITNEKELSRRRRRLWRAGIHSTTRRRRPRRHAGFVGIDARLQSGGGG